MIYFIKFLRNYFIKNVTYRHYKIGKGFHAGIRVRLWAKNFIEIGENFYIGRDSFIECDVKIGDNVIFGNRVALIGRYDHHYQQIGVPIRLAMAIRDSNYNWKGLNSTIVIENDVWVGYGSTILSGIRLGEGSIVAAGSLVTKSMEPYTIYGGVPARKIKNRFDSYEELQQHLSLVNL